MSLEADVRNHGSVTSAFAHNEDITKHAIIYSNEFISITIMKPRVFYHNHYETSGTIIMLYYMLRSLKGVYSFYFSNMLNSPFFRLIEQNKLDTHLIKI